MPAPRSPLHLVVVTPHGRPVDLAATSVRVPADTGQVGLRPDAEGSVLAVEPGLVLARSREGLHFVATAGGLLRCDGRTAVLMTPVAVTGDQAGEVSRRLERALAEPTPVLEAHRAVERLEAGLRGELRARR